MIAATVVLLATVVCIGKYKITPGSADDGLWIALLVTLSVIGVIIVALMGHQDVYSELFQPGPAPIKRSRSDAIMNAQADGKLVYTCQAR